jgi:hypothetical protein
VLDQALWHAAQEPVAATRAWVRLPGPETAAPFLFTRPLTAPVPRWPAADVRLPHRSAHRLTEDQQRAFNRMSTRGADLPAGFTIEELRHQYRRLARRYHPDRHAHCAALERAQLARCFVEAVADYRCLRVVVEPRH